MNKEISISKGNMKLVGIPNINLPPIKTCRKNAPCCRDCYSMKAYRLYPSARRAWDNNYCLYKSDPKKYFNSLNSFLKTSKPKYFRFHSSGDFVDSNYLSNVLRIVKENKDIKFLAYTKQYELLENIKQIPDNFSMVLSAWPGLKIDKSLLKRFPVAWMWDKKNIDKRIPKSEYINCSGDCNICIKRNRSCWNLKQLKKDVIFKKH